MPLKRHSLLRCPKSALLMRRNTYFSGGSDDHENDTEFVKSPPPKVPKSPLKTPKSPTKAGPLAKKKAFKTSPSSHRVFQTGLRTVYTSGRPPWYDSHGYQKDAFVIGQYEQMLVHVFNIQILGCRLSLPLVEVH